MKRIWIKIYMIFYGGLVSALIALLSYSFYPELPNTPTSKSSLKTELGIDPSTVDAIYHAYSLPDFHGDDGHHFRFRYPSERWIDSFKLRFQADRLQGGANGLSPQSLSWWDWNRCREVECYRLKGTGNAEEFLWIDKKRKLAYVNIYNW